MNGSRLKIALIFTILIAVALITIFWVSTVLNQMPFDIRREPPQGGFVAGDFEFFYLALAVISTINIALLVIVLFTYINIYHKTRSPFTVGLIIFALAFLLKDIASSPFVAGLFSFRAYGLGPFAFLPGVFEFTALSVLLYLSVKY
ncbi:MAG: hypothetical protein NWE93_04470 [Candidatus Bathyarchaeota archaeon]|nr:hypothetical protein [Candidatus Bathyarchaeota archaeon]